MREGATGTRRPLTSGGRAKALLSVAADLVRDTAKATAEDAVPRLAAAMAYWLLVTLSPLVLAVSALGTYLFGVEQSGLPFTGAALESPRAATLDAVTGAFAFAGPLAWVVSFALLIFGAVAVFRQFVDAIGVIWKTPPADRPIRRLLRHNLLSLLLLLVFALGSLVALTALAFLQRMLSIVSDTIVAAGGTVPPDFGGVVTNPAIAGALATFGMFALAFWLVPARVIRLRDVLPGAALTAAALVPGSTILLTWLPSTTKFDIYGAFGSFVALIVFIYYAALIALVGAEFTRQWVLRSERVETT
ncbi:MAG: YihY/virulence factor BrkB family protein [Coriobacteriales bacterium]|nr:YihY/virulence factor BrkB family protein [Coriobacteriales bacterium]